SRLDIKPAITLATRRPFEKRHEHPRHGTHPAIPVLIAGHGPCAGVDGTGLPRRIELKHLALHERLDDSPTPLGITLHPDGTGNTARHQFQIDGRAASADFQYSAVVGNSGYQAA